MRSRSRKRPCQDSADQKDEHLAECAFSATVLQESAKHTRDGRQVRTWRHNGKHGSSRVLLQGAPFKPAGGFRKSRSLDATYVVEPEVEWLSMTRYNSFVLNGAKFCIDDYIYVANERTVERPSKIARADDDGAASIRDKHWVAKVLEIRAADEHHVYVRVYWMYWPDELPAALMGGKKMAAGRQPYHGRRELVASNHMDIINVFTVAMAADVKQWVESNDDDVQDGMFWRQALDCRTMELSTVEIICRCALPANPDELLVGCTKTSCQRWMHYRCLLDDVYARIYARLGKHSPHSSGSSSNSADIETNKRRLEGTSPPPRITREELIAPGNRQGRAVPERIDTRRKNTVNKPDLGVFEAVLRLKDGPTMWEVTDKREGFGDVDRTWTEVAYCLMCGTVLD